MGGPGPVLTPAPPGTRRDWWEVEALGFIFKGRLSDIAAIIGSYKATLTDRAGNVLWAGLLTEFEPEGEPMDLIDIALYLPASLPAASQRSVAKTNTGTPSSAGAGAAGILYSFNPPITSPSHPVAYLNTTGEDTPILKDNLRMDAMLVATRMFQSE